MRTAASIGLMVLAFAISTQAHAVGSSITYQGRLVDGGVHANGLYDLEFRLFAVAAPPPPPGPVATHVAENVEVTGGLFTVELPFGGSVFDGNDRWLEIAARPGSSTDAFTTLTPRQKLNPVAYAFFAPNAGSAGSIAGGLAGEVTGDVSATVVSNAVPANTANAIVRRDGSGGFSAGTLSLEDELMIKSNGIPFLREANHSTFLGALAASGGVIGSSNTGIGWGALKYVGSGHSNSALGTYALQSVTSGTNNIGIGATAGALLETGSNNIYIGTWQGSATESETIRIGQSQQTVGLGQFSLWGGVADNLLLRGPSSNTEAWFGSWNTAFGARPLSSLTSGNSNSAFGTHALSALTSGSENIAIGRLAGASLVSGSYNIYIGSNAASPTESLTIRLGDSLLQQNTFLSGSLNIPGDLSFGSQTRQLINLLDAAYAIGVQPATLYFRTGAAASFAWYAGGSHADGGGPGPGGTERMRLDGTGLTVNGTFVSSSDRAAKQDVEPVDGARILDEVGRLHINEWSYKSDPRVRHVGPMAQDFWAAFGLGADDRHIATVDADGVALAAIQALNRLVQKQQADIGAMRAELEALRRGLETERTSGGSQPHSQHP